MDTQSQYLANTLAETKKSANAAESSASTAAASLEVSKRAIVVIDSLTLICEFPNVPMMIKTLTVHHPKIIMKNVGETEALECWVMINASFFERAGDREISCVPTGTSIPTMIHRGKEFGSELPAIEKLFMNLAPSDITDMFGSYVWEFRVHGYIEYRDIFKKKWRNNFTSALSTVDYKFRTQTGIVQIVD